MIKFANENQKTKIRTFWGPKPRHLVRFKSGQETCCLKMNFLEICNKKVTLKKKRKLIDFGKLNTPTYIFKN